MITKETLKAAATEARKTRKPVELDGCAIRTSLAYHRFGCSVLYRLEHPKERGSERAFFIEFNGIDHFVAITMRTLRERNLLERKG